MGSKDCGTPHWVQAKGRSNQRQPSLHPMGCVPPRLITGPSSCGLGFLSPRRLGRLAEAEALAADLEDVAAVGEAIQQGGQSSACPGRSCPSRQRPVVAGQQNAGAFVAISEDLEEQLGAAAAEGQVPEFIVSVPQTAGAGVGDTLTILRGTNRTGELFAFQQSGGYVMSDAASGGVFADRRSRTGVGRFRA